MDDDQPLMADEAHLVERIEGLEAKVRVLERRLDELGHRERQSVDAGPSVVVWRSLSQADETVELVKLAQWVDWLQERYAASGDWLRPCWWRHGLVVEELAALRTAWRGVYECDQATAMTAALSWHESAERCRERIRRVIGSGPGCTALTHRPDQPVTSDSHWIQERAALGELRDLPDQLATSVGDEAFHGGDGEVTFHARLLQPASGDPSNKVLDT